MPLLLVLACACFVGSFSMRMIDPLVPAIASDLATAEANVSLLASAFAIPYALVQPVLGPVGDLVGKTRVIKICLFGVLVATALAVVATSIEVMFMARVVGGLAGGGIIPLAFAVVGDNVPFEQRQVALSQVLTASIGAILTSTIGTGLLATMIGWRGVFAVAAVISAVVFVVALFALKPYGASAPGAPAPARSGLIEAYGKVLANPLAYICLSAVFFEGVIVLGLLPFVASLLAARGAGGVFEAGLVLAGFALGGLLYAQIGSRLVKRIGGVSNLIRIGGVLLSIGYFGVALQGSWTVEMLAFLLFGIGFYAIHNSLQTHATELAPQNRGASVALFAFFFFLGQSVGPPFYAFAFHAANPGLVIAAVGVAAFGFAIVLARLLER